MKSIVLIILASLCIVNLNIGQEAYAEVSSNIKVKTSSNSNNFYQTTLEGCPIENGKGLSNCSKESIYAFLEKYLVYPEAAEKAGIEEQCEVFFSVGRNGQIEKTLVRVCHKSFEKPINLALSKLQFSDPGSSKEFIHRLDINFSLHGL